MKKIKNVLNKIYSDERGSGFTEILVTVVVTAIIGIIIISFMLPMFDATTSAVKESENATTRNDKIVISQTLSSYTDGKVLGGDVIGNIRFSERNANVHIIVTNASGSRTYISETYDESDFAIGLRDEYNLVITDEGNNVTQYNYVIIN